MLKYWIASTQDLLLISLAIATFYVFFQQNFVSYRKVQERKTLLFFQLCLYVGGLGGLLQFVLKRLYPRALNIALIQTAWYLSAFAGFFLLLAWVNFTCSTISWWKKKDPQQDAKHNDEKLSIKEVSTFELLHYFFHSIGLGLVLSYVLPRVLKYTTELVYFGEQNFSTQSLLRFLGLVIGTSLCIALALACIQCLRACSATSRYIYTYSISLLLTTTYVLLGISNLGRLRYLPAKKLFALTVFSSKFLIYGAFLSLYLTLLFALYVYTQHRKVQKSFSQAPQLRKEKARLRRVRRWTLATTAFLCLAYLSMTVLYSYDNREEKETPPEAFVDAGQEVHIPLTQVNDGHLHRFVLQGEAGTEIKFIIVKKNKGNAYGVGFDACEICGSAGYIERHDNIVCKRCDVVMNKSTIGFKGGCNPIPLGFMIEDGTIKIQKEDILKKQDVFRKK